MPTKYISKLIVILFSFLLLLKASAGVFHVIQASIIIAAIILLSFLYELINSHSIKITKYKIIILFFIFYMLFTTTISNAPIYGTKKSLWLALYVILGFAVAKHIISNLKLFINTNTVFFILFIISYFIFYKSFGDVLSMLTPHKRNIIGGDTFSVIGTSRYVGFNLINLYFLFLHQKEITKKKSLLYLTLFAFGITAMILFGTKGPIVALIFAPFLYYMLNFKKASFKKVLIIVFTFIASSFILNNPGFFIRFIPYQYQSYFEYRYFNFKGYENDRPSLYKMAFQNIDNNSFLLGKGTGDFGYIYYGRDEKMYPHNIFIEILFENGLVGIMFFTYILLIPLIKYKKTYNNSRRNKYFDSNSYIIILVYYFLINAQVSGDLVGNYLVFLFLIVLNYQNTTYRVLNPQHPEFGSE